MIHLNVGDGSDPTIRYMLVDTIQIVWSHNCEHGFVNGFDAKVISQGEPTPISSYGSDLKVGSVFEIGNEYIQCGPEQVIAKIPTLKDDETDVFVSMAKFLAVEEILTAKSI